MKRRILLLLVCILVLTGCSKGTSSSEKSGNETVELANKLDLFNCIESLLKKVKEKKYIDAYDSLSELYKLTNQAGIVYDSQATDKRADDYITTLDKVILEISNLSDAQKRNEIIYEAEKQELKIISNMISGEQSKESGSSGGTASGGSQASQSGSAEGEDSSGSGSGGGGGETGGERSGGTTEGTQEADKSITIPEEEILKKYPELILSETDYLIMNDLVTLMDYVTQLLMEQNKEHNQVITNREKFLLYKIEALSNLNQYSQATNLLTEAQSTWDMIYMKTADKDNKEVIALNATIKNMKNAIKTKNNAAIEIETKNAIELLEKLSTKKTKNSSSGS